MNEKCQDLMTKKPACCAADDNAQYVAQMMRDQDVGSIPCCDASRKPVGIVTDRDLALKIVAEGRDPKSIRVSEIMSRQLVTCRADDNLEKALDAMESHQLRRIPVVDNDGRIIGIIAQADIATRLKQPQATAEMVSEVSKPSTRAGGA